MHNEKKYISLCSTQSHHQCPCIQVQHESMVVNAQGHQGVSHWPPSPQLMGFYTIDQFNTRETWNAEEQAYLIQIYWMGNQEQGQTVESFGSHPNQGFGGKKGSCVRKIAWVGWVKEAPLFRRLPFFRRGKCPPISQGGLASTDSNPPNVSPPLKPRRQ